jgi:hypothetical protein
MRLTLDRDDLLPEFRDINCSQTKFEHFSNKAQRAIFMVGKATFYEYDGSNYNVIYAPKENK